MRIRGWKSGSIKGWPTSHVERRVKSRDLFSRDSRGYRGLTSGRSRIGQENGILGHLLHSEYEYDAFQTENTLVCNCITISTM